MAIPAWPAIPYRPRHDGFAMQPVSAVRTSEMEAGNKRQRRIGTIPRYKQTIALRFTQAEFATFRGFHETDLDQGASPFTMNVWNGSAFVSKTVIMVGGEYQASRDERLTRVTFDIETQD